MGKTVDLLKQAEELRSRKVSAVIPPTEKSRINFIWLIGALGIFIILLNLFIATRAFLMSKNSAFDNRSVNLKLNKFEEMLNKNSRSIVLMNEKVDLVYKRVEQFDDNASKQAFAIDNLAKAKNNLINRINTLETEIQNIAKGVK